jgi:uncharacterized membrane protein HdeD (DUF308 family)
VLAVCGGGGNDVAAVAIILGALLAWVGAAVLIIRTARDRRERLFLVGLLLASILVGPFLIKAFYDGVFGSDTQTAKLALVLLIPGVTAAAIAVRVRGGLAGRAFVLATWGAIFLGGFGLLSFFAAVVVGTGCIE